MKMKLKNLLAVLLILVMCFSLAACKNQGTDGSQSTAYGAANPDIITSEDAPVTEYSPLLYKVTDDKGNTVWLFGSIHVGRDDFYPLPDYIMNAYNNADSIAVEADVISFQNDLNIQMEALSLLVYKDGTTIQKHIPSETYDSAVKILKNEGVYNELYGYYMPVYWQILIEQLAMNDIVTGSDSDGNDTSTFDNGIDMFFLELAHEQKKDISEIESAKYQYGMMADFSEDLQELMLEAAIESYNDSKDTSSKISASAVQPESDSDLILELMDAWAKGDAEKLSSLLNEQETAVFDSEKEKKLFNEYYKAMFTDRDKNMTDYAVDALKSGKEVFICVGAAHVVGKGAMVDQLKALGYTVESVK